MKELIPSSGLSEEFGRLNFQPTSYIDTWSRKQDVCHEAPEKNCIAESARCAYSEI
jgi:hypothetical protein